ncbi:hypothetical protein F5X96DRAFT_237629 [Biscogniauxia mediterranea]|nr:hypothetical protein F5X96DRAFT_237629 [Biscogniauxia mediterranea]
MVPPSDMSAKAKARAQDVLAYGQRQVDRVVSPPARQKAYDSTFAFASARPILSSFLLTQALFALLPLLLFSGLALSAATACLFCFALFWAGVAALFLAPALLLASALALLAWGWGLAVFLAARATYRALPAGVRGDAGALMRRVPGAAAMVNGHEKSGSGHGGEEKKKTAGGKRVIFQHHQNTTNGEFRTIEADIKAEAAEVEE